MFNFTCHGTVIVLNTVIILSYCSTLRCDSFFCLVLNNWPGKNSAHSLLVSIFKFISYI